MSRPADDALYVRYLTLVRKHLSYAAADELDADRALSDYGLDSQGTTGLVFAVEAELGTEIPDDLLTVRTLHSPGSLWSAVWPLLAADTPAVGCDT